MATTTTTTDHTNRNNSNNNNNNSSSSSGNSPLSPQQADPDRVPPLIREQQQQQQHPGNGPSAAARRGRTVSSDSISTTTKSILKSPSDGHPLPLSPAALLPSPQHHSQSSVLVVENAAVAVPAAAAVPPPSPTPITSVGSGTSSGTFSASYTRLLASTAGGRLHRGVGGPASRFRQHSMDSSVFALTNPTSSSGGGGRAVKFFLDSESSEHVSPDKSKQQQQQQMLQVAQTAGGNAVKTTTATEVAEFVGKIRKNSCSTPQRFLGCSPRLSNSVSPKPDSSSPGAGNANNGSSAAFRRQSLPAQPNATRQNLHLQSQVNSARGLLMDLLASSDRHELAPNVRACLRAVTALLNSSGGGGQQSHHGGGGGGSGGTASALSLMEFGVPQVLETPFSGEVHIGLTSKPRVSNITFSTVTSATGLPTIAAEPSRARSSSYWKPILGAAASVSTAAATQSASVSSSSAVCPPSSTTTYHAHPPFNNNYCTTTTKSHLGEEEEDKEAEREKKQREQQQPNNDHHTKKQEEQQHFGGQRQSATTTTAVVVKQQQREEQDNGSVAVVGDGGTGAKVVVPSGAAAAVVVVAAAGGAAPIKASSGIPQQAKAATAKSDREVAEGGGHTKMTGAPKSPAGHGSSAANALTKSSAATIPIALQQQQFQQKVLARQRVNAAAGGRAPLPAKLQQPSQDGFAIVEECLSASASSSGSSPPSSPSCSASTSNADDALAPAIYKTMDGTQFDRSELDQEPELKQIQEWSFPIFHFADKHKSTVLTRLTYAIFKEADLFRTFKISHAKFFNYFHALESGYWDIPYHNRIHAADVLHGCYYLTCHPVHAFYGYHSEMDADEDEEPSLASHSSGERRTMSTEDPCSSSVGADDGGGAADHHHQQQQHGFVDTGSTIGTNALPLAQSMSALELMALYTAAAMHDFDHPGRTNAFLVASEDRKAILYNDRSVLENHHAAESWRLLTAKSQNHFTENLDSAELKRFRYLVLEYILATDLKQHFDIIMQFNERAPDMDLANESDRVLLSLMLIKFADINSPAKPHSLHRQWTKRICQEFYEQGDEEKQRHMPVSPYMDRNEPAVAKLQDSFIAHIVNPLAVALNEAGLLPALPGLPESELIINLKHNHQKWLQQLEQEQQREQQQQQQQQLATEEDRNNNVAIENNNVLGAGGGRSGDGEGGGHDSKSYHNHNSNERIRAPPPSTLTANHCSMPNTPLAVPKMAAMANNNNGAGGAILNSPTLLRTSPRARSGTTGNSSMIAAAATTTATPHNQRRGSTPRNVGKTSADSSSPSSSSSSSSTCPPPSSSGNIANKSPLSSASFTNMERHKNTSCRAMPPTTTARTTTAPSSTAVPPPPSQSSLSSISNSSFQSSSSPTAAVPTTMAKTM